MTRFLAISDGLSTGRVSPVAKQFARARTFTGTASYVIRAPMLRGGSVSGQKCEQNGAAKEL